MASLYQLHIEKWKNGCGAQACEGAKRICFARGKLPCDVLFIGEAPGVSEDSIGQPFVGPAGHLINRIIYRSFKDIVLYAGAITDDDVSDGEPVRYALTNLVGCIPKYNDGEESSSQKKAGQPSIEDIMSCAPRLQDMIEIARPRMIVCVGALARDWLRVGYKNPVKIPRTIRTIDIVHPAHILRANISVRGLMEQRCVVQLRNAIIEIEEGWKPPEHKPSLADTHRGPYIPNDDDIPF